MHMLKKCLSLNFEKCYLFGYFCVSVQFWTDNIVGPYNFYAFSNYLTDVFFHFIFSSVVGNSADIAALWSHTITIIHHSLWLIVDYFTVVVAFPCSFIFLKRGTSKKHDNMSDILTSESHKIRLEGP